jgi:ligand-binding sensor domain-containing protein
MNVIRWLMPIICLSSGLFSNVDLPQRVLQYRPGDWISYSTFRYITSAALGREYVYFGTTGGVLRYQFYESTWKHPFTVSDGLENDHIRDLIFDFNSGFLWCLTDTGVSFRDPSSEYWRNNLDLSLSAAFTDIGVGTNYIWVTDGKKTIALDQFTGYQQTAYSADVTKDDVRWMDDTGERPDNRYFMDPQYMFVQGGIQDSQFRTYPITVTIQDNFRSQWLGTWGLGIGMADKTSLTLIFHQRGLYSPDIQSMAWDQEGMWIGGLSSNDTPHGITYWNMKDDTWQYYEAVNLPGLLSDAVTAIVVDESYLWFATLYGLARYDKKADEWRTFTVHDNLWDDEITCLSLNDSILWVGTPSGINRIDHGNIIHKVTDDPLLHRHIFQIDAGKDVWAGTDRGIYQYRTDTNKWQAIEGYAGMVSYEITSVAVYGNEVWFGSEEGIQMLNRETGEWNGFPSTHFQTSGVKYTILPDETAVWVGCDQGVRKYIRKDNRWHLFTTEDGLLDNHVRWILLDGDNIWFGTPRGLTKFYWNAPYRID